jgi:hypothetical protein
MERFGQRLDLTHTQRHHAHDHTAGDGHMDQSRFKSFPIQVDDHFLAVCWYRERNADTAGLCTANVQDRVFLRKFKRPTGAERCHASGSSRLVGGPAAAGASPGGCSAWRLPQPRPRAPSPPPGSPRRRQEITPSQVGYPAVARWGAQGL